MKIGGANKIEDGWSQLVSCEPFANSWIEVVQAFPVEGVAGIFIHMLVTIWDGCGHFFAHPFRSEHIVDTTDDQGWASDTALAVRGVVINAGRHLTTIVNNETSVGENWNVCATPNDNEPNTDGTTVCSNNVTIQAAVQFNISSLITIKTDSPDPTNTSANLTYQINVTNAVPLPELVTLIW